MALNKIECPECGAGLKSSEGFSAGEEVECPKCEASFIVEEPDADAEEAAPRKKKKKADKEKSYKSSPMRFAVLGVLVAVMCVLGGMLYLKMKKDKETEEENAKITARNSEQQGENNGVPPPIVAGPNVNLGGAKKGGAFVPPMPAPPKLPNGQLPKVDGGVTPKFPMQNPPSGGGGEGLFGLGGGSPTQDSAEGKRRVAALRPKLIGSWEGTGPDGTVHKVTYMENGQFTHDAGGKATNGTWQASGFVGDKVLKVTRGAKTLKVAFEDDREIIHDTETAGVSLSLKKK